MRLRHENRNRTLAASYTVEAALLMSVILPVLIIILNTAFFLCDSVRMTALMQEKARLRLEGNGEEPDAGGFFRLHQNAINIEKSALRVRASAKDIPDRQLFGEYFEGEVVIIRRHPHVWIRIIRGLQAEAD